MRWLEWLRSPWRAAREDYELEFLPAALEVIESPASPVARLVMLLIAVFCVIATVWAALGEIDIIATAPGRIIPSGKVKVIQPFEIGIVKRIAVRDGQQVQAGELLVELDATSSDADQRRIARELLRGQLDVVRLKALLKGITGDPFAELAILADPSDLSTARQQMEAQASEQAAKLETLEGQLRQQRSNSKGSRRPSPS